VLAIYWRFKSWHFVDKRFIASFIRSFYFVQSHIASWLVWGEMNRYSLKGIGLNAAPAIWLQYSRTACGKFSARLTRLIIHEVDIGGSQQAMATVVSF
jgi:hypothetical protein